MNRIKVEKEGVENDVPGRGHSEKCWCRRECQVCDVVKKREIKSREIEII